MGLALGRQFGLKKDDQLLTVIVLVSKQNSFFTVFSLYVVYKDIVII